MNKKLVTIAALMLPYCASASNDRFIDPVAVNGNACNFYLKGTVGGLSLNNLKMEGEEGKVKVKSKNSSFFGVGVGYYFLDNLRTDLSFEHHVNPTFKGSVEAPDQDEAYKIKATTLDTLMLNGYVDLIPSPSVANIFIGGGVGVAKLKEKITCAAFNKETNHSFSVGASTKAAYNFAYSLTAGVSLPITDRVYTELSYSWRDFGKTKPKMDEDGGRISPKNAYRGHNISLGFRVSL